jgi:hypothetical protein
LFAGMPDPRMPAWFCEEQKCLAYVSDAGHFNVAYILDGYLVWDQRSLLASSGRDLNTQRHVQESR